MAPAVTPLLNVGDECVVPENPTRKSKRCRTRPNWREVRHRAGLIVPVSELYFFSIGAPSLPITNHLPPMP